MVGGKSDIRVDQLARGRARSLQLIAELKKRWHSINVHADDSIDDAIPFREIKQLRKIQGVIKMATHSVGSRSSLCVREV